MKKILWAVDAFEESQGAKKHLIPALRSLASSGKVEIEPVYVLSPDGLDIPVPLFRPWIDHFKPAAEKALEHLAGSVRIPGMLKARILFQEKPSLGRSVQALARYAKGGGFDAIAVGTHARSGLARFFVGSFTETLLLTSKVPVLVAGPRARSGKIRRILFPTDFGERSGALFRKVLELAADLGARVEILHVHPHPIEPVVQSGVFLLVGGWVPVPEYLGEYRDRVSLKHGDQWLAEARAAGVKAEFTLDPGRRGVSGAILARAESSRADLIAMAAQSGPVATALVGSITRQVVRAAACPVWVMRL